MTRLQKAYTIVDKALNKDGNHMQLVDVYEDALEKIMDLLIQEMNERMMNVKGMAKTLHLE